MALGLGIGLAFAQSAASGGSSVPSDVVIDDTDSAEIIDDTDSSYVTDG